MNSPKEIFERVVKGMNFMTPSLIRHGRQGDLVYELSTGPGIIQGTKIYGVTVVDARTREKDHDLSDCFRTQEAAEKHISTLRDTIDHELNVYRFSG